MLLLPKGKHVVIGLGPFDDLVEVGIIEFLLAGGEIFLEAICVRRVGHTIKNKSSYLFYLRKLILSLYENGKKGLVCF